MIRSDDNACNVDGRNHFSIVFFFYPFYGCSAREFTVYDEGTRCTSTEINGMLSFHGNDVN